MGAARDDARDTRQHASGSQELVPDVFGHYRVTEQGPEDFGCRILHARHSRTNRDATVRVLMPNLAKDRDAAAHCLEDARKAGALNHPNIAEVIAVGTTDAGAPYIISEPLKGDTLESLLTREIPVKCALQIGVQLTAAIAAAHAAGIAHGGLMPSDLIVSGTPETGMHVKVSNFGLPRFDLAGRLLATVGDPFVRRIEYLAPEWIEDPASVDFRVADVYGIGAILYAMLAGVSPFAEVEIDDLPLAMIEREPRKLRDLKPELRIALTTIVQKSLRKARERDQPVASIHEALVGIESEHAVVPVSKPGAAVAAQSTQRIEVAPVSHREPVSPYAKTMIALEAQDGTSASPSSPPSAMETPPPVVASSSASPVPPPVSAAPVAPVVAAQPRAKMVAPAAVVADDPNEGKKKKGGIVIFAGIGALAAVAAIALAMRKGPEPQTKAESPATTAEVSKATDVGKPSEPARVAEQPKTQPAAPAEAKATAPEVPVAKNDGRRPAPVAAPRPAPVAPARPVVRTTAAPAPQPVAATPAPAAPTPTPSAADKKKTPRSSADLEPY